MVSLDPENKAVPKTCNTVSQVAKISFNVNIFQNCYPFWRKLRAGLADLDAWFDCAFTCSGPSVPIGCASAQYNDPKSILVVP